MKASLVNRLRRYSCSKQLLKIVNLSALADHTIRMGGEEPAGKRPAIRARLMGNISKLLAKGSQNISKLFSQIKCPASHKL